MRPSCSHQFQSVLTRSRYIKEDCITCLSHFHCTLPVLTDIMTHAVLPAAGHNDQTEAFFKPIAKGAPSKIWVFFYSIFAFSFVPSKGLPVYQAVPAVLEGEQVAVEILNFGGSYSVMV